MHQRVLDTNAGCIVRSTEIRTFYKKSSNITFLFNNREKLKVQRRTLHFKFTKLIDLVAKHLSGSNNLKLCETDK